MKIINLNNNKIFPNVSILVVNYNGKHHFEEFLSSIFKLNYPKKSYEIIIVDNASDDGSIEFLRNKYLDHIKERKNPKIKIINFKKNYGFSLGNNLGVNYCDSEYIALINNDTVVDPYWLSNLMKYAVKNPKAIYGSLMLRYDNKNVIVYAGGRILYWGYPLHIHTYEIYSKHLFPDRPISTFYADGCGLLISKELFLNLGGFDPNYFAYAEDYELCWKAWIYGYKVYFVPSAIFWHKISSTLGRRSSLYLYLLWRNQFTNILKFCDGIYCITMPILYVCFGVLTGLIIFGIQERNSRILVSIIKGIIDSIKHLPYILKQRKLLHNKKKITCNDLKRNYMLLDFKSSLLETIMFLRRASKINIV